MDFPLLEITEDALAEQGLHTHFHPNGLQCPHWHASVEQARRFRQMRRSHVTNYRCRRCAKGYTVSAGTVFANQPRRPTQVILL